MNFYEELIGSIAAILTTISFLPQVIKTYKEKSAENLSTTMLLVMTSGVILWLIYGILKNSFPLIAGNVITLVLTSILIYFKFSYSKKS